MWPLFQYNVCTLHLRKKGACTWFLFQYIASKFLYLLIKQIKEGVAIVSVQCMHTPLIKQIKEGVAILSVQCIKLN